jgi:hypothetical protein
MTGHCNLRKHLHTMGNFEENPVYRLCNEEEETVSTLPSNAKFCLFGDLISWGF